MTTIGGPGGIGGPKGPEGLDGPLEIHDLAGDAPVEQAHGTAATAATTTTSNIEALAAEVAAGRLTQREAIDRLVEATAGPELDTAERAELRELLTDLVANDPYLGGLVGRI